GEPRKRRRQWRLCSCRHVQTRQTATSHPLRQVRGHRSRTRSTSTAPHWLQSVGTALKSASIGPRNNHGWSERIMRIGVPKEIKVHEYRVGLAAASVGELIAHGHEVVVETKAGTGIDCPDRAYEKAGAQILPD